jgi:hypothetical protein
MNDKTNSSGGGSDLAAGTISEAVRDISGKLGAARDAVMKLGEVAKAAGAIAAGFTLPRFVKSGMHEPEAAAAAAPSRNDVAGIGD